jgi:uncharacterized delta-60 repeat protein
VLTAFNLASGNFQTGATASGLAIAGDGRIVVVGTAKVTYRGEAAPPVFFTPYSEFAVARYWANGRPDTTFGNGGKVMTSFGSNAAQDVDTANGVAIQADGKVVVVGSAANLGTMPCPPGEMCAQFITWINHFALARFNSDGSLDTGFGNGGKVRTDFMDSATSIANGVVLEGGGRIVVAGTAASRFALARYTPQGILDAAFGDHGRVLTDLPAGQTGAIAGLALAAHGRLAVAGSTTDASGHHQWLLARYLWDGSLDNRFGDAGKVWTSLGNDAQAHAVAVQADGKIVVAGTAWKPGSGVQIALARYEGENPPLIAAGIGVHEWAGRSFTAAVATFTDLGGLKQPGSYTAMIDWGDGRAAAPDVTRGRVQWIFGTTFQIFGTHTYAAAGVYHLKVVIQPSDGAPAQAAVDALVQARTGIQGVAMVGPVSPVARPGVPNTRPLPGAVITVKRTQGGPVIARTVADQQGRFQIDLAPGTYLIVPLPPRPGQTLPRGIPQTVKVTDKGVISVVVSYDSGIR